MLPRQEHLPCGPDRDRVFPLQFDMNKGHWPIPDIPGTLLEDEEVKGHLLEHLSNLCGLNSARFPGSQPVSFSTASLELLESKDFWVCEKTDGVRVLVFIVMNQMRGSQEVWLVSLTLPSYLESHS